MGSWFSRDKVCHKTGTTLDPKDEGVYALIPFDASNPNESNDLSKNDTIYTYSKDAFQELSVLDFTKAYDVINPVETNDGVITFIMVHGGGASRAMFRPYSELLSQRGYRCILPDLPGHGTLAEEPLTIENCIKTIDNILEKEECQPSNTVYVGASLGAYVGFEIVSKLQSKFCAAVMLDCGQNVGPDCSFKAKMGLWMMKIMTKSMTNHGLMNTMLFITKKSPADWKLVESTFGAGMFFQQSGPQQIECMHSVKPAEHIPLWEFPVMFMNGSEDHRDSEEKWLSLCKDKSNSYLKVYEGGDHFFSHDSRFVDDILERMDDFAKLATSLAAKK